MKLKKIILVMSAAGTLLTAGQASATNWLKLQGTEDPGSAGRAKVWGFLQPTYQKDYSTLGVEPTRIGPNLETQEQFQLYRARIGVRGIAMPLDSDVNYFAMFEMGHNGATDGGANNGVRTPVRMMDASVTLNHIPKARIRIGLFKTPGPEEIFQGLPALDYINFSWVGNQMMMERYAKGVTNGNDDDAVAGNGSEYESTFDSSFGAARDTGVQVFDWFDRGDWTHSYAVMYGNGNGLEPSSSMTNGSMDTYLYWSSERNYEGGKGPWANGWKTYVWSHTGKRNFISTDSSATVGTDAPTVFDRTRTGFGTRYRRGDLRLGAEYMAGKGMIFQGPEKPGFNIGPFNCLSGEADGYVLDVGYYVPKTKWELDLRYDVYNRCKGDANIEAKFTSSTLGVQYHLNRKSKILVNYEMRKGEATGATPFANLVNGLATIGDRVGVQVTTIF